MSVKLSEVEFMKKDSAYGVVHTGRVIIRTQREITKLEMLKWPIGTRENYENIIKDQLAQAILHHIYGDLVVPINELAILAQHHITGVNDQGEIEGLRECLRKVIQGEELKD